MISEFIASWPLFQNSYLAGWLIAVLLSLLGVFVVARDQIFAGAAVSQASLLGIAVGMYFRAFLASMGCAACESDTLLIPFGVAFGVLTALLTGRKGVVAGESHEALTGWAYLLTATAAVLLLAHSPHGLEEVERLIASTILGATRLDLGLFGVLVAVTVLVCARSRAALLLLALDSEMAAAVGIPVGRWSALFSAWLGLSIGMSIRVAGAIFTFGALVLPAMVAKSLCREVSPMLVVAPVARTASRTVSNTGRSRWRSPPRPGVTPPTSRVP